MEQIKKIILDSVDQSSENIVAISHQIHEHPEMGNQEVFASNLLINTLEEVGFSVERQFSGIPTAFCARKGQKPGAKVAFLAEYDALPGLGHACGHNLIATSALAAGIGLGAVIDEVGGEVWVIGTPAEETDGAKTYMSQRGAFNGLDAALMIHPHSGNYTLTNSLALSSILVDYYGKSAHAAAAPWEGKNALDAVLLLFNSLNALRQQIRPDARIHGVITKGGEAPNIIPDHTQANFYVRASQRAYLNELRKKFYDCANAASLATGCRVEINQPEQDFDEMVNNVPLAERFRDHMVADLGSAPFKPAPDHFGSIDMGNVSQVVPAIHCLIDITEFRPINPHTHEFAACAKSEYADLALLRAGKGLALTGLDVLSNPEFRQQVKAYFKG
ncbi:MAG TPA: M20 family metallopeptidase [Anaerolineaceae bacterium]